MNHWTKNLVIALVTGHLSTIALAQAGGADALSPEKGREATIGRLIEERGRLVINRYVTASEFYLSAQIQAAVTGSDKIPYLPPAQSAGALSAFALERLVAATNTVTLTVGIAKRYKPKTREKLAQILTSELSLRPSDKITFEDLGLDLPPQRSDIEINLMRLEADLRQERLKAEQIRKERDDLKLEVVTTKSTADQQAKIDQQAKSAVPADPATGWISRLKDFGIPGLFAALGLMVALILAKSFGGIGRGIVDAARAVSGAIEASSSSVAVSAAATDVQATARSAEDALPTGLPPVPLESLQRTVKELHEDLSQRLDDKTQPFVIQYLSQQLAAIDTIDKGVAAMELFGQGHANSLFEKLNPGAQVVVLDFIRQGHYTRPKLELMHEAGDELNTRLLGLAVMQSINQTMQEIMTKIAEMQTADLAQQAMALPESLATKMLGILAPGQIATVLAEVHRVAPGELARVSDLIMKIPEARDDKSLDAKLLAALTTAMTSKVVDVHGPYLKFYGEIMAAADESVSESIFEKFKNHPQIVDYIRKNSVTFSMFFQVTKETQEEVVQHLTVKDLASLTAGLSTAEEKNEIEALLPERRREAVREEAALWAKRGGRQLMAAHKVARQAICRRMSQLQKDNALEFTDERSVTLARPVTLAAAS